jgi:hypothetical protein
VPAHTHAQKCLRFRAVVAESVLSSKQAHPAGYATLRTGQTTSRFPVEHQTAFPRVKNGSFKGASSLVLRLRSPSTKVRPASTPPSLCVDNIAHGLSFEPW